MELVGRVVVVLGYEALRHKRNPFHKPFGVKTLNTEYRLLVVIILSRRTNLTLKYQIALSIEINFFDKSVFG